MFKDRVYVFDIILLILGAFVLYTVLNFDIVLENQFVPTVLSGLTSCTALIVGFMVTVIAISITQFKVPKDRIAVSIFILLFSITFLTGAYAHIFGGEYYTSLRYGMLGLNIASLILLDFITFFTTEAERLE